MTLGRDVLGGGDEPSHFHGPATAGAHGDVDAKDAGQQRHPGRPRRSSITQLSVEQGCGGRELDMSARDKQRELLGLGRGFVRARHHRRAQGVVSRHHSWSSRGSELPVVGPTVRRMLDSVTMIPPLHPYRDLAGPSLATRGLDGLIQRGFGEALANELRVELPDVAVTISRRSTDPWTGVVHPAAPS